MKLKSLINKGVETVSVLYPEREAKEMVFAYMEDIFGIKRHKHVLEPDYALSEAETLRAEEDFEKMAGGQPLQYVTTISYSFMFSRPCKNRQVAAGLCRRSFIEQIIKHAHRNILSAQLPQQTMGVDTTTRMP